MFRHQFYPTEVYSKPFYFPQILYDIVHPSSLRVSCLDFSTKILFVFLCSSRYISCPLQSFVCSDPPSNLRMQLPYVFCCFVSASVFLNTQLSNSVNLPYTFRVQHGFTPIQATGKWKIQLHIRGSYVPCFRPVLYTSIRNKMQNQRQCVFRPIKYPSQFIFSGSYSLDD